MSSQRKRKKDIIDELFGSSLFGEKELLSDEAFESGYSISVTQTLKGTKIKAKVGKDADVNTLRRQLQQQYPNAEIEIEGGRKESLIKEISTRRLKEENNES
ncbi:hypothetical protein HXY32_02065 [Candidatus Bathyarchaeota archaeon]|nr:hypothetical protein [Candidatus Bathyarchaeota archaeon]